MVNWVFCSIRRGASDVAGRRSPHRSVEEMGNGEAEWPRTQPRERERRRCRPPSGGLEELQH